jgi:hypothetical protein
MIGVQGTKGFDQLIVIGWSIAQEHDIGWSRPQSLQAVGKFAAAASDFQARLPAKSATQ